MDDALRRIESLYKPYHRALRRLLTRVHRDRCRRPDRLSFDAVDGRAKDDRPRADIVLGDRYGTSCVPIVAEVTDALRGLGYASAATSPMPAASSPSITATRPRGSIRSRSSSIARSTWTSAAMSEPRVCAAVLRHQDIRGPAGGIPLEE